MQLSIWKLEWIALKTKEVQIELENIMVYLGVTIVAPQLLLSYVGSKHSVIHSTL